MEKELGKVNTFCFLTLSAEQELKRAIYTLWKNTPHNFYVFVTYQGKNKNLLNEIKEYCKELTDAPVHLWIVPYRNLGFAKGMNTMIKLVETEYVTVSNDDVEFLDPRWWSGVMETFKKYSTALGVNPNSPRNLDAGGIPRDNPRFPYRKNWTKEQYDKLLEFGKGTVVDGICTFCTVFKRKELVEDVGLYDESFWNGGEDYDLNRRAYLKGYRMLGTSFAWVWHWWVKTKSKSNAHKLVADNYQTFYKKWQTKPGEIPDIYGKIGKKEIPPTSVMGL